MLFSKFESINLIQFYKYIFLYIKSWFFLLTGACSILLVIIINLFKEIDFNLQVFFFSGIIIVMLIIIIFIITKIIKNYKFYQRNRETNLAKFDIKKESDNNLVVFGILILLLMIVIIRSILTITIPYRNAKNLYDQEIQIIGKVVSFTVNNLDSSQFSNDFLKNQEYEDFKSQQKVSGGAVIIKTKIGLITYFSKLKTLEYGDTICVNLVLKRPLLQKNPGGFNEKSYLDSNGIYLKGSLISGFEEKIISGEQNLIYKSAYNTRTKVIRIFSKNLPPQESGLMSGVLIGDRKNISSLDVDMYKKAGLSHITAVSGSAVSFLLIPLKTILRKFKIAKRKKNLIIFAILIYFGFITGWTSSVSRALLMVFLIMSAKEIHKNISTIQALFISVTLLINIFPIFALNAGFYLSSFATAGIIELSKSLESDIYKIKNQSNIFVSIISTSIAAGIAVLPISIWILGEISLSALISSVFALPLVELATVLGSIVALFGFFNENYFFTQIISIPLQGILFCINRIAFIVAKINFLQLKTYGLSFFIILSLILLVIFVFLKNKKNKRTLIFVSMLFLSVGVIHTGIIFLQKPDMEIVFADVGQGDATLIILKTGQSILIDSGGKNKGYANVKNLLDYYSIKAPNIYIASHTHEDHCGGLISLINERGGKSLIVPFNTLKNQNIKNFDSGLTNSNNNNNAFTNGEMDLGNELIKSANDKKINVKEVGDGDVLTIMKDFEIYFYNPVFNSFVSQNSSSLVMKIKYKDFSIIIMGDATKEVEERLVKENKNLKSIIYRISHHGSPSSTNRDIINAVDSKFAIISVGQNFYGHPSPKVIDRLNQKKCNILRTDQNGAVIIKIKKDILNVSSMLK